MTPAARRRAAWAAVDWRKPDHRIAQEMGVGVLAVKYQRKKRQNSKKP